MDIVNYKIPYSHAARSIFGVFKNKQNLQVFSRQFFMEKSKQHRLKIIFSVHITDEDGVCKCIKVSGSSESVIPAVNSPIEEADAMIMLLSREIIERLYLPLIHMC